MDTPHELRAMFDLPTLTDDLLATFDGDRLLASAALANELLQDWRALDPSAPVPEIEAHCIATAGTVFGLDADAVRVGALRLLSRQQTRHEAGA